VKPPSLSPLRSLSWRHWPQRTPRVPSPLRLSRGPGEERLRANEAPIRRSRDLDFDERLWSYVNRTGPVRRGVLGRCWIWTGASQAGYGRYRNDEGRFLAPHRYVYAAAYGPLPAGARVRTTCGSDLCVRSEHLEMIPARSLAERLWSRTVLGSVPAHRPELGPCLEFTGCRDQGYGTIRVTRRKCYTHRVAWTLAHGPIPSGFFIDHQCENRACCNPLHLEPVDVATNNRRAAESRRRRNQLANIGEAA
jgi:hypothetical protein